ncbi:MAG: hypothetical protein K5773_02635 [Pseudobutyrivibrio sp.]|nr:hypothetical protein [Pseudobutyrivibrio sp.]
MSSNNVVHGFQVSRVEEEGQELIIDSNARANELIALQQKAYKERLLKEEKERRLAEMEESGAEIPEGMTADEFLGLADSIMQEEEVAPEPSIDYVGQAREEADRIIADANASADEILSAAETNANALKTMAQQDGRNEGYNEGTQRAAMELQTAQQQMQEEIARMEEDFRQRQLTMERDIIEMCLPVFERVFGAELEGKKDVLYHLLDHCIMKIERTGQMQIKVSDANAEFIKGKKEEIQGKVGSDVGLDIIADPLLNDSQCIIETDGGIFDCSIDTELDNLIREIKALSYKE